MAWLATLGTKSVWPSGAAAATSALPSVAPTPGRFSMTEGCPSRSCKPWATRGAAQSVIPQGAEGATRRIGCDGQPAVADAGLAETSATHATGAGTAARRDKPPDISLPVFGFSGPMARGLGA